MANELATTEKLCECAGHCLSGIHGDAQFGVERVHCRAVQSALSRSGCEVANANIRVAILARQCLGESSEDEFGGGVGGKAGVADDAKGRADVDYFHAVAISAKLTQHRPSEATGGGDVGAD